MDSQEWAEQFPTVSVKIAKTILASHGWDDDSINCEDDRILRSEFTTTCKLVRILRWKN